MELTKKLAQTPAPCGREEMMRDIIKERFARTAFEISTDALGNIICRKKGNGKRIMLTAPMDEAGLMITYITEEGFLRFVTVGKIELQRFLGGRVCFANGTSGIICCESEDGSRCENDKMFIDIGCKTRDEAEKKVSIGDIAAISGQFFEMGECISANALHSRAVCRALICSLEEIELADTNNDVCAVFTVQSEVGHRGLRTAAYALKPDMLIALTATSATDVPGKEANNAALHGGPIVRIKDSSYMIHPYAREFMLACAQKNNIRYAIEALDCGDSFNTAVGANAATDVKGVLALPVRYKGTPCETVSKKDMESFSELIKAMLAENAENYIK